MICILRFQNTKDKTYFKTLQNVDSVTFDCHYKLIKQKSIQWDKLNKFDLVLSRFDLV